MCGIVAIYYPHGCVSPEALKRATGLLHHRGPAVAATGAAGCAVGLVNGSPPLRPRPDPWPDPQLPTFL
jgi:hypothetical protein